jgi:uncharacterized membrane protein
MPGPGLGDERPEAPSEGDRGSRRISRLAKASFVLGVACAAVGLIERLLGYVAPLTQNPFAMISPWLLLLLGTPLILASPIAVVLGAVALVQMREQPGEHPERWMAIAGSALAFLAFGSVLHVLFLAVVLVLLVGIAAPVLWIRKRSPASAERRATAARTDEGALPAVVPEDEAAALPPRATPVRPALSSLAVASLVLAALAFAPFGLVTAPAAVVVGVIALIQIGRSRGRLRGQGLAGVGILVSASLMALTVWMIAAREGTANRKITCLAHMKDLAVATQMYLEDYDNRFPPAAEWCESLKEYARSRTEVFHCPAARNLECAYAYNATLSARMYDQLADAARLPVVFESDRGWEAAGGPELVPPEPRHFGGDNLGFADGHAAWMSRQRVAEGDESRGYLKAYSGEWLQWTQEHRK